MSSAADDVVHYVPYIGVEFGFRSHFVRGREFDTPVTETPRESTEGHTRRDTYMFSFRDPTETRYATLFTEHEIPLADDTL